MVIFIKYSVASGWLRDFVKAEFPETATQEAAFKKDYKRCLTLSSLMLKLMKGKPGRTALEKRKEWEETWKKLGKRDGRYHKRRGKPGKTFYCPEVREELFAWFVDTIENVKGRISSHVILHEAETILADYEAYLQNEVEAGRLEAGIQMRIVKLNMHWLFRWRKEFQITWRTVNLRYKISRVKLNRRVELFFINLFKIRWLHYFLNGERQILRFSNSDQKPMWFTTASMLKTLARIGQSKVVVVENVPMTRMRFSPMTRWEWPRKRAGDDKKIALLFKGTGTRTELIVPDGVLVQWGPKGSYRTEHTVEYYDWIVEPATCAEMQTLYLMDWYAPNFAEEVVALFTTRNHGNAMFPGSTTDILQTNDTNGHGPLNGRYKQREVYSSMKQLREGVRMPCSSKQTVLDRTVASFDDLNHDDVSFGFVQNMIAADLHGSDDATMASALRPIWEQCGLQKKREEIGKDIKARVDAKELTDWHDYKKPGFLVEAVQIYSGVTAPS